MNNDGNKENNNQLYANDYDPNYHISTKNYNDYKKVARPSPNLINHISL